MEPQPKVSFENTEIAFSGKSDRDLKKAYYLFKLIGNPSLVKVGDFLTNTALKLHIPIGWAIKSNIFKQFCGGEDIQACERATKILDQGRIGTILDYSVEGKDNEKDFDATAEKLKRKIGNNEEVATYLSDLRDLIKIRRETQASLEKFRAEMNVRSKEFGTKAKSLSPEARAEEQTKLAELKYKIQNLEESLSPLQEKEEEILLHIPNIPSDSTPHGHSDSDNPVIRHWGEEWAVKRPLTHDQIGEKTGLLSGEDGAKLSGSRFVVMKGDVAKMDRRLTNFFLDRHTRNGYVEVSVPYIVTRTTMTGTGQLPKFEEDLFKVTTKLGGEDAFLIPTADVPVTNLCTDLVKLFIAVIPVPAIIPDCCVIVNATDGIAGCANGLV
jgi:hypothetical protein